MTGDEMWLAFCQKEKININTPHDTWKFCGGGTLANELAKLVLEGTKTATTSLKAAYDYEHSPIPEIGCLSVILFDDDTAACIIKDTKVSVVPFDQVSAEHAYKEGEDDCSLVKWREVHKRAFTLDYALMGLPFDEKGDCVLEEFEMVYSAH